MNKKNVTVLGGFGFIGSYLCQELLIQEYNVTVFTKNEKIPPSLEKFKNKIKIFKGDINYPHEVLAAINKADILVHLIHTTKPGSSMKDPEFDIISNIASTVKWAQSLNNTNVKRIIYCSSGGTVYGRSKQELICENHPTDPICAYGISKLAIEKYLIMYSKMFDIDCFILRPSNIYGFGQDIDKGQGVIGTFINRIINKNNIEIWGSGNEKRDYVYIDDFISAVIKIINYNGNYRLFNVGSEFGVTTNEILSIIIKYFHTIPKLINYENRIFDVSINVLNYKLLKNEVNWEPEIDLEEGIVKVINKTLQNKLI